MSETAKASAVKGAGASIMRSQLGRVRGLGSARSGTAVWWAERVTSLALIPLTIWFVLTALHLAGHTRLEVAHWTANPINATLMIVMLVVTFQHTAMGLQVVIEDYIHVESTKLASLLAIKGLCALLAVASVVSVLKLAFTG
jgi:succinate dehydrogenase / fumarate reductase membrane anchor subunit